jgi:hypothetical protein
MCLRMLWATVMVSITLSGLSAVVVPKTADAIPAFSRQTGKPCSTCHSVIPKLNQTGQNFRTNGFRFPEEKERKAEQDLKHVPGSAEIEVEAEFEKKDRCVQDPSAIE